MIDFILLGNMLQSGDNNNVKRITLNSSILMGLVKVSVGVSTFRGSLTKLFLFLRVFHALQIKKCRGFQFLEGEDKLTCDLVRVPRLAAKFRDLNGSRDEPGR